MDALKTKIEIQNLTVVTYIGCLAAEQNKPQKIALDISIQFDGAVACESDRLEDTVDYHAVRDWVVETCNDGKTFLLEHLAWKITKTIFKKSPQSQTIHLKIKKFTTMPEADHVAFELTATRDLV